MKFVLQKGYCLTRRVASGYCSVVFDSLSGVYLERLDQRNLQGPSSHDLPTDIAFNIPLLVLDKKVTCWLAVYLTYWPVVSGCVCCLVI